MLAQHVIQIAAHLKVVGRGGLEVAIYTVLVQVL